MTLLSQHFALSPQTFVNLETLRIMNPAIAGCRRTTPTG